MAFEERIDVHSELYDVRTAAIKNFENKGLTKKRRSLEVHFFMHS
jgi:Fe-S cluster assembly protein SufD